MKLRILEYLGCPVCRGALACHGEADQQGEVWTGRLACRTCEAAYPITDGIPRMLAAASGAVARLEARFGWQWSRYEDAAQRGLMASRELFLNFVRPLQPDAFRGKLVLDAGCGAGRFIPWAVSFGAREVFAIDITEAIEVTARHTRHFPNVHCLQGDILRLPLRRPMDLIYSIGTLHHLPDVQEGLRSLTGLLAPEGQVLFGLYNREQLGLMRWPLQALRRLARHVPCRGIRVISRVVAGLALYPLSRLYRASPPWLQRRFPMPDYLRMLTSATLGAMELIIFDQLAPPVAHYTDRAGVHKLVRESGLRERGMSLTHGSMWTVLAEPCAAEGAGHAPMLTDGA